MKEHIIQGEIVSGVLFIKLLKMKTRFSVLANIQTEKGEGCSRGIECIIASLPPHFCFLCVVKSSSVLLRLKGIMQA